MNAPAAGLVNIREVEAFVYHEARLLDGRRFEEWIELFAPEGYYWAPARPDQNDPWTEISLIFDDREFMKNRIQRLRHPKVHAQIPPSRAVRQISNVTIDKQDANTGDLEVRSVFSMFEYRPTLPKPLERMFAGESVHRLRPDGNAYKIMWKKVLLANCDSAFDPLFLYF